jgi:hypothetical protein
MERVEAVIARQQHSTHISVAPDIDAKIEDMVFSMQSAQRLHNEDQQSVSSGLQVSSVSSWLAVRNLRC